MAQGTLAPTPILIAQDANGAPVSGAKAYWYLAGTSTPATVYTDVGLTVAHASPVVANGFGRFAEIFLSPGASYKLDIQTPGGVSLSGYPADNISAVPSSSSNLDITGTAGEALSAGQPVYQSAGDGGKTAGQWYQADATNAYSSTFGPVGMVPAAIAAAASGTIRLLGRMTDLSALTIGAQYFVSGTPGAITATQPVNRRLLGTADTTSSLVLARDPTAGHFYTVVSKTTTYAIVASDDVILCTGTFTATLPTAVGRSGQRFTVKNVSTGVITIATTSAQTIDGVTTATLGYQYDAITVESDNANWHVVDKTIAGGEFNAGNSGAAITINFATNGPMQKVTRTANCTFTLTPPVAPTTVILKLVHEASGTVYTVTFSPTLKYPAGAVPTYTNTSGAIDILTMYWDGTSWYAVQQAAFA